MSAHRTVDVLVVGLGPAGASAAAVAGRGGLEVLCVERKQQVGVPVQCAEYVPLPLAKHTRAAGVLQQRVAGMRSVLHSGTAVHSDFPGLMVDRAVFDQTLVAEARSQGVECWLGARLLSVDARRGEARVRTQQDESTIGYRLLIAADGPHSPVAESLGLAALDSIGTRQYTVPLLRPCTDTEVWLSDAYPGGYAWLFPKGLLANLGIGMDKVLEKDMKRPLDALHRQLIDAGRVGADILSHTGGAIPVGGLRETLAVGNVLFVGDAAGLTHPITGAGIAAAVQSGERAGEAAVQWLRGGRETALAEFEEDIRDQFGPSLRHALARRHWLRERWRTEAAAMDETQRAGWVAFPEYFERDFAGELQQ
jgi:geranylgeranyl reductase family protein